MYAAGEQVSGEPVVVVVVVVVAMVDVVVPPHVTPTPKAVRTCAGTAQGFAPRSTNGRFGVARVKYSRGSLPNAADAQYR